MKRKGFLTEQIADTDNLHLAFFNAQKGKRSKEAVIAYRKNLDDNLKQLQQQILTGKISVGKYKLFNVYDPKQRVVCAAAFDERVLHHAIMNVCEPYFERQFINTTYANRKNKGTYKALDEAHKAMGRYEYVAKLDVRKYFDNIGHERLMHSLGRLFKDKKLLQLLSAIIESYQVSDGKGLPIGNLTSQYFANFYLSELDHFAKEKLRTPVYLRYMDDILLFCNDKNEMKLRVDRICKYAATELGLEIKPPIVQSTEYTIAFLGYSLAGRKIALTTRSKRRFERKYRSAEANLNNGSWTQEEYQAHILPLIAFTQHAYTKRYRRNIMKKVSVVGL